MAHSSSSVTGEFRLIRQLAERFSRSHPSVLRGIGDDAAVVRCSTRQRLLLTTDLLAEGIHFDLRTATFEDIGYKAAVANLSDIAAMGGKPHVMLVALALPRTATSSQVERLYRGMMRICRPCMVVLVGGDTSASRHGWFISMTMTGVASPHRILYRSGARPGDDLWVSGTLGDSAAGLQLLAGPTPSKLAPHHVRTLIARHRRPTPRIALGQLLASQKLATAAIDVSDGLSGDLAHVCEASGMGVEVVAATLPLSPALRAYALSRRMDAARLALQGGEDYELLFTAPSSARGRLERLSRRQARCPLTRIGTITRERFGLRLRQRDGELVAIPRLSYEHFSEPCDKTLTNGPPRR